MFILVNQGGAFNFPKIERRITEVGAWEAFRGPLKMFLEGKCKKKVGGQIEPPDWPRIERVNDVSLKSPECFGMMNDDIFSRRMF